MPLILPLLRITSLTEAVSFLLLMFVAMPLKYMLGFGLAVQVVGMIHGVLFTILFGQLVLAGRGIHRRQLHHRLVQQPELATCPKVGGRASAGGK